MIKSFNTNHKPLTQTTSAIPLHEGARKVFEEASGVSDLFVPEVEDRYEDMAADFLEQWLGSSGDPFTSETPAKTAPNPAVDPKPAPTPESTPVPEPQLTTFSLGLDWQLADGRKL
ncbi:MAG: hypothetical protein KC800_28755 [Candidatus Eremiobacteraeota bacterium]|nr:hypothetical protein [Candidatus Eremiobacteraeota bacterium]